MVLSRRERGYCSSAPAAQAARSRSPCLRLGFGELVIHDSDESRVATLIDLLSGLGQGRLSAGPPDPTGRDLVCNATPLGMDEGDPLPVDAALLTSSMFVGDVIAGHGVTAFLAAAESAGCKTANGGHMVEAAQDVMADFMLRKADSSMGDSNVQQGDRAG